MIDQQQVLPQDPAMQDPSAVSEQDLMDLRGIKEACDAKVAAAETARFTGNNAIESKRGDLVRKVMDVLREAGVDPADPASVARFRKQLFDKDPDLLAMFDEGMRRLVEYPDGPAVPSAEPQEASGL